MYDGREYMASNSRGCCVAVRVFAIAMAFLLYGIVMTGLFMILLSKKLWSPRKYTWKERLEPKVIAGFACMFIPILLIACGMCSILR